MGCEQSTNNLQRDTNEPQKQAKKKNLNDYDELMGNVLPQNFIDEETRGNGRQGLQRGETQRDVTQEEEQVQKIGSIPPTTNAAGTAGTAAAAAPAAVAKDSEQDGKKGGVGGKVDRREKKAKNKIRGNEEDDSGEIYEKFKKTTRKMKHQDLALIVKCLKEHFVFYALSDSDLEYIVRSMFYCEVAEGEFVFKQGDKASCYFILESDRVEVIIDGVSKKKLAAGTSFGELALLYNAPRSASIRCLGNCGFWAIDRATFRKTVEEIVQKDLPENRKYMEQVSFFNFMNPEQKDSIAQGLISQKFSPGQDIVHQGDQADSFYMIKEGTVSIWRDGKELRKLVQGDSFGENALYMQSVRMASVRADSEVKVLSLARDSITRILGDKVQIIVFNNLQRWAYDKSALLSQLTKIQVEKITHSATIKNFAAGTVVYEKGKAADKLVIVLEGKLVAGSDAQRLICPKGQLYGDDYLPAARQREALTDSVVMGQDGVLSTIPFSVFFRAIGGPIEEVLQRNVDSHEKKMAALEGKPDYSHIRLEKLIYVKQLGHGQFGTVFLVVDSETVGEPYALKSVSKAQIIEQNLEKHLLQEKMVLEQTHFPFIMTFYRTFKDSMSVYFLTKYIQGMELFDAIREIGLLNTYESQYYIGSMLLGLEYLHTRQIIYRDIKPENIMVDINGHMYIIDLGTAKILNKASKHHGRTFTIIGTPHYMAPEVVMGKGYSLSVDLWSVGICLYEFMCGGVPFAEDLEDPFQIYNEIMRSEVTFPSVMRDKRAKKMVIQLLSKVPELRLGGSYAALKAHTWFDDFDWDKLYNKELKPPFLPQAGNIEADIKQARTNAVPVIDEIEKEQRANKKKYRRELAKDPDWDKDF